MSDSPPPMFGPAREPCRTCGALLAGDQRYCLSCGTRRAEARLPFLDILRGSDTQLVPFGQPLPLGSVGGSIPPHDTSLAGMARANIGLIAGVGVLLLAMLIGVLIGSNVGSPDHVAVQAAPKPQIIQVAGAAAPAAAATTAATTTPTTPAAKKTTGTSTDPAAAAAGATKATNKSLGKLQSLSGKAYQKQIDKLGKTISTGGKPPPKDNKPAGGGSASETIG